jgi:predicted nucleotide-binding protein
MMYYHVYIEYKDKKGEQKSILSFNNDGDYVRDYIASPYMKNERFFCLGFVIDPSNINRISIYESETDFRNLILPNGETPVDMPHDYIVECFGKGRVKGVYQVTCNFITLPPKEKEKPITPTKPLGKKEKAFIVHGRDDEQALLLQKYLKDKLKIDAVMFDDLPDKGRTIIEQLEYIKDNVFYAFVIVTPDDVGCLTEDIEELGKMLVGLKSVKAETVGKIFGMLHTRARQNVVFELGLFISALGRENVCCLLKQDTDEKPSDIDGILYKSFNKSVKEIFHEIADELKEY